MSSKLYVNDRGQLFTIKTEIDLSNVNTVTLEMKEPGTQDSVSWIASVSNPTSGTVTYVVQSGDLSTIGIWEGQVFAWESNSSYFHGDTFNFEVFDSWQ
jgi:hypothetical protein